MTSALRHIYTTYVTAMLHPMIKSLAAMLCLFVSQTVCTAQTQSIDSLQRERELLNKQLSTYSVQLDSITKIAITSKTTQKDIQKKIDSNNNQIKQLHGQISSYRKQLNTLQNNIDTLNKQVELTKERYAKLLRAYQGFNNAGNQWYYVLTAKSMSEAYMRTLFINRYTQYVTANLERLNNTRTALDSAYARFKSIELKLSMLSNDLQKSQLTLENDRYLQQQYSAKLSANREVIKKQILEAQSQNAKYEKEIQRLIELEAKRAAEEAARAAELARKNGDKSISQEEKLSNNIIENKGRLPWPANDYTVKSEFGNHPHPMFKEIMINNNGIDILLQNQKTVHPIHAGVVTKVILIPGNNLSVIVRHGNISTVYSNLNEVNVKKDQQVTTETIIGSVYDGPGLNSNTLHFELWQGDKLQNPQEWLKK